MTDGQETEIKLRAPGPEAAQALLTRCGFHVARPRVFERNTVFDTSGGELRASRRLLRLRATGDGHFKVTFKGKSTPGRHKSREELETGVEDGNMCAAILGRLGFRPTFVYEKFRTEFEEHAGAGVVTYDETPIGNFLEIEGEASWIDDVAGRMGFQENDYITSSYGRLYEEWRLAAGKPPGDMRFPETGDNV